MPNGDKASSNGQHSTHELIVAHTSDLHLGGRTHKLGPLDSLTAVLEAADETHAAVLILAGDVFDSHRAPTAVVEGAALLLADATIEVVILPGNHDPATPDAVYRRPELMDVPNLHILGVNAGEHLHFPDLDLEVSGAPHLAYVDMSPLPKKHERRAAWHIVVAHGHYHRGPEDSHRGWLMHDHEIAALDADYLALGHWDVDQPAGDGPVKAFYSGSPELSRTMNVVTFGAAGVDVRRHPLRLGA